MIDALATYTPPFPLKDAITGVELKLLKTHGDQRGFFREIIRTSDPLFAGGHFGQWSHSRMQRGVVKAWHYHHIQFDWWYVPIGKIQTVLFDNRPESPTFKKKLVFKMGDSAKYGPEVLSVCVRIPPGVLHGCKVLSSEAHLFYITSVTYDPNEEGRFPYDQGPQGLRHSWGKNVIVADNDKRAFVPTSTRSKS
ncbi:MAG: dTDP-4-dehydrorhamnose 3,5-epimerase family protein [Oligoflexia bacterium]|nr:dTDP-4-dehydrorhamnose 3,5-epimerase family protein [Oligoflexia bacterium]